MRPCCNTQCLCALHLSVTCSVPLHWSQYMHVELHQITSSSAQFGVVNDAAAAAQRGAVGGLWAVHRHRRAAGQRALAQRGVLPGRERRQQGAPGGHHAACGRARVRGRPRGGAGPRRTGLRRRARVQRQPQGRQPHAAALSCFRGFGTLKTPGYSIRHKGGSLLQLPRVAHARVPWRPHAPGTQGRSCQLGCLLSCGSRLLARARTSQLCRMPQGRMAGACTSLPCKPRM